ncbi:anaerobic sulfatase maturase [Bryobacter aggregatus]|uniref:anaerobic sulfatase maturase n=1 Tax=Bryobacter aggregatus TaxID=360054 RepID=UPI000689B170|nr:anaerobic sulfatase maturase [Bryobacter aggregatus]
MDGEQFHILGQASGPDIPLHAERQGPAPRISSILIKPASALCNLDCSYCFYLDRDLDPYAELPKRRMSEDTLQRLVDSFLFYSYPNSTFAFQGGEPTLAGLPFFEKLVEFQQRSGRNGQNVSNALQTNGVLLDKNWAQFFKQYNWLIGLSLDGPEGVNDKYRYNKEGHGTHSWVLRGLEALQREGVDFNILCVVSQANVGRARELYKYYKSLGVDNVQYIPLAEFAGGGKGLPYTVSAREYGQFLVETFEMWWPDRRKMRIRFFDNIAEAIAGQKPGNCTMHDSCDSYCVVEYNGDVFPCDFFVEGGWKLGNIHEDSWAKIARRNRRQSFAEKKSIQHPECQVCDYKEICHGGCPKFRHGPNGNFSDLDYFCESYKMIFNRAVAPLEADLSKLLGQKIVMPGRK